MCNLILHCYDYDVLDSVFALRVEITDSHNIGWSTDPQICDETLNSDYPEPPTTPTSDKGSASKTANSASSH